MTCQEFFEKHRGDNNKCKHLQVEPLRLEWQKETASKHSPEPVSDTEELSRQVFSPIHIDMDSKSLKPTALSDAEDKGLSVFRLNYSDEKKVIQSGRDKALADNQAGKSREFVALAKISAGEIRKIKDNKDKFGFGIYDTALKHEVSHADICHVEQGKQSFRSIRSKLLEIASKELKLI